VITARDICPQCSHLWDIHCEDAPGTIDVPSFLWQAPNVPARIDTMPCKCCIRMGRRVKELNGW
jgi:hypothetical protein